MRRLATIQQISEIKPIENADNIELAIVKGWQVVVKKHEFKVNDLVVYCEIDSVLPEREEFEFLKNKNYRIKTIKLRKQISQGICFPLDILKNFKVGNVKLDQDVTKELEVTKYVSPAEQRELEREEALRLNEKNKLKKFMMRYSFFRRLFLTRTQKERFPYWISKTDEERLQNFPHVLEQFKDYDVVVTEKIDYQSVTFTGQLVRKYEWFKYSPLKYKFVVCSRNLTVNKSKYSLYWQIAEKYNIENILKYNHNITIQGEQGSTNVQNNKYQLKEPALYVFNVINHKTGYHYDYYEMLRFCEQCNLTCVPLIETVKLKDIGTTVQDFVEYSKGKSKINPNVHREGIVIRIIKNGQKLLSFKVINPDFLLKYDE